MTESLHPVISALQSRLGAELQEQHGESTLMLPAEIITKAAEILRNEFQFDMLIDITAVDYWPQDKPRYHVVYHFLSTTSNLLLRLRSPLDGSTASISTLANLYPNANWYEREVWDMFGIRFEGHPDLRRIVMPSDWAGHPLRKDYPLGYEEVQFTFNAEEIMARKPKATRET